MTVTVKPMRSIYTKLNAAGYKQAFVKSILPEWWDDEIASSPSGLQQASLILAKLLSVRPETLWANEASVTLAIPSELKFKRRADATRQSLDVACAIAYSAARLVLRAFKHEFQPELIGDAAQLRNRIIDERPWVDLPELLGYCTQIGIPVIYLSHFPSGAKKMAGLAFAIDGRPVIVITQSQKYGYALFDLAHELGHITLGHVAGDQCVVDQKIDQNSEDEDEKAANRFALELLTGDPDCKIVPTGRNLTGQELATAAKRYGENKKVDPLHVVLNYGYATEHWGAAHMALKSIVDDRVTDQQYVRNELFENLDIDVLGEDDLAVIKTLCGVKEQ